MMMKKTIALLTSSFMLAALPTLVFSQPSSYNRPGYGQPMPNQVQSLSRQLNWLRNYEEAVAQSQATGKPIVILFTGTSWCPACMKLEREVLTKPEFAQAVGNRFIFVKAEFPDYAEEAIMRSPYYSLIKSHGIEAFPTMVIVNANGQRLYTVNYQAGGPGVYINELLQKLDGSRFSRPSSSLPNQPYYR